MPHKSDTVVVGPLTAPDYEEWGHRLRRVYQIKHGDKFADLLQAIDRADTKLSSHERGSD